MEISEVRLPEGVRNATVLSGGFDELCRELYRKLCRNPLKGRREIDKARDKAYDKEGLKLALKQRHSGQSEELNICSILFRWERILRFRWASSRASRIVRLTAPGAPMDRRLATHPLGTNPCRWIKPRSAATHDLRERIELVSQFGTGEIALRELQESKGQEAPDLVLLDLNLPGMSGLEATPWFLEYSPHIKIIILTQSDRESDVLSAPAAVAKGYKSGLL